MNSEEIRLEAQRRIANMTEEQKREAMGVTEEEMKYLDNARNYWNMTKEEQAIFQTALLKESDKTSVGGGLQGSYELNMEEDFGITRDDIKNGVKNPYKRLIVRELIIILICNVGAVIFGLFGLKEGIYGMETVAGLFAIDFARNLMNSFKFKKLQAKYMSGELEEQEIEAEISQQLWDEHHRKKEEAKADSDAAQTP